MDYSLREYYASYLQNVRKLKPSSVLHYLDAIRWISHYLRNKKLIRDSLYEIQSIDGLKPLVETLMSDEDFVAMDKRGHQMYSAGLNNYMRFVQGDGLETIGAQAKLLDVPMPIPSQSEAGSKSGWDRSEIIKDQSLKLANYTCELNTDHKTFISARNGMPYMEGHHSIPMKWQSRFSTSLDVYANIICICPVCHRLMHFGRKEDIIPAADKIYYNRADRMAQSGIVVSHNEFLDLIV